MNLRDYLHHKRITQETFIIQTGISRSTLYRIIHGKMEPTLKHAITIVEETKGEVTYKDLVISDQKPDTRNKNYKNKTHSNKN